jgi:hypothetical protein
MMPEFVFAPCFLQKRRLEKSFCNAELARLTLISPRSSLTLCKRFTPASCWLTTSRRHSTGRKTWTMRPLPNSSVTALTVTTKEEQFH